MNFLSAVVINYTNLLFQLGTFLAMSYNKEGGHYNIVYLTNHVKGHPYIVPQKQLRKYK